MELLVALLVLILIVGVAYWVASLFLPEPFPKVVLVVGLIVALLYLLGNADGLELDLGDNR